MVLTPLSSVSTGRRGRSSAWATYSYVKGIGECDISRAFTAATGGRSRKPVLFGCLGSRNLVDCQVNCLKKVISFLNHFNCFDADDAFQSFRSGSARICAFVVAGANAVGDESWRAIRD